MDNWTVVRQGRRDLEILHPFWTAVGMWKKLNSLNTMSRENCGFNRSDRCSRWQSKR